MRKTIPLLALAMLSCATTSSQSQPAPPPPPERGWTQLPNGWHRLAKETKRDITIETMEKGGSLLISVRERRTCDFTEVLYAEVSEADRQAKARYGGIMTEEPNRALKDCAGPKYRLLDSGAGANIGPHQFPGVNDGSHRFRCALIVNRQHQDNVPCDDPPVRPGEGYKILLAYYGVETHVIPPPNLIARAETDATGSATIDLSAIKDWDPIVRGIYVTDQAHEINHQTKKPKFFLAAVPREFNAGVYGTAYRDVPPPGMVVKAQSRFAQYLQTPEGREWQDETNKQLQDGSMANLMKNMVRENVRNRARLNAPYQSDPRRKGMLDRAATRGAECRLRCGFQEEDCSKSPSECASDREECWKACPR